MQAVVNKSMIFAVPKYDVGLYWSKDGRITALKRGGSQHEYKNEQSVV